jgi:hypothetical protein
VIWATADGDAGVGVAGVVRGLASEAASLVGAVERFEPGAIGLGLAEDETRGLLEYFVDRDSEPLVPLMQSEAKEIRALGRFGEVRVPHPAFVALLSWAKARDVPMESLDPSDDQYAEMFAHHIGYFELLRRTLAERRLLRAPPEAETPDEFVLAWNRRVGGGRGSRRLAEQRDAALALAVRRLRARHRRVAVAVDRERFEGVLGSLRAVRSA